MTLKISILVQLFSQFDAADSHNITNTRNTVFYNISAVRELYLLFNLGVQSLF